MALENLSPEQQNEPAAETAEKLSPELVQKIAEKVYALWQRDLKYEQERTYRHERSSVRNRWYG